MSAQTQVPVPALNSEMAVAMLRQQQAAAVAGARANLLVVLCSEQATRQVVNTGSLYS